MMNNKGFTLVELAIVLVIIGIILGAVLKGQEVIDNAKAKRVLNDLKGLEALTWTFYDRYNRLPGDCPVNAPDGYINNWIYSTWYTAQLDTSTTAPTSFCTGNDPNRAFNDLKYAGLVSKESSNRLLFKHTFNPGAFFIGRIRANGQSYNAIAINRIPCWVAQSIDSAIDGSGFPGAGRIRSYSNYTANVDASQSWSDVCSSEEASVSIVYLFDRMP